MKLSDIPTKRSKQMLFTTPLGNIKTTFHLAEIKMAGKSFVIFTSSEDEVFVFLLQGMISQRQFTIEGSERFKIVYDCRVRFCRSGSGRVYSVT